MIDIYRISFSKERLCALSSDERAMFFLLGHAANQIAVFRKLVVFSTNISRDGGHVQGLVEGAQTQILVRHFIGVVFEAWKLVNKRFIQRPIGEEYQSRLEAQGADALAKLKSHFEGSNILNRLRNNVAFHHPRDTDLAAGFKLAARTPDFDDEWNWYLAAENTNSFYFISEIIVMHAALSAIGETDVVEAQKRMMIELNHVSDQFITFASHCLGAILEKHFGPEINAECCEKVEDAPDVFAVDLPFYTEGPKGIPHKPRFTRTAG